jgi:hypothetical protein
MRFWFSLQIFLKHISLKKEFCDILSQMYIRLRVKCTLFLSDSNETWISSTVFPEIVTYENQSSRSRVFPCGRTNKQVYMTKIRVAVLNVANASKRCEQVVSVQWSPPALTFFLRFSDFAHGMILTGTTRSNRVKLCHRAALSTRSLTVIDLGLHSDEGTIFRSFVPTAQSTQCISTGGGVD